MYYVYFLESETTGQHYIGYTRDINRRPIDHNRNRNVSTANRGPWKLIYFEAYLDQKDALGREKFLKSGAGWRFLKKQLRHYLEGEG